MPSRDYLKTRNKIRLYKFKYLIVQVKKMRENFHVWSFGDKILTKVI